MAKMNLFSAKNLRSLAGVAVLALAACSHSAQAPWPDQSALVPWLRDGMIAVSRPVPVATDGSAASILGFMPLQAKTHVGSWLSIDRSSKNLALMEGERQVNLLSGEGVTELKPGTYHIVHKQRSALWYAPDSYFAARNEPVPAQGDKNRYRRGALGEFVLYLDKDTPIHNGPIWSAEIGGVRLSDSDISRLYYSLDIGSTIEVR